MADKWESYELQFIREVAGIMPASLIAEKLERTQRGIQRMARKIGVSLRLKPEQKEQP